MFDMLEKPYTGPEKLVIGIDLGTTSTAVSIAHLYAGAVPTIRTVSCWPASPTESKLPSLVYFNSAGQPVAFGAESLNPQVRARAIHERLHLAKWWKLHLHPRDMQFDSTATLSSGLGDLTLDESHATEGPAITPDFEVPPLPPRVTIERIYSAFLGYVVEHAEKWFVENAHDGEDVWDRLIGEAEFILATPDGWADVQQAVLRKALVSAGVLGEDQAQNQLEFLRESEASVHFALKDGAAHDWLKPGAIFTVADLGGSTVDVCMYRCDQTTPTLELKEIKPSDSVQAGGVYVDRAAEVLVNAKLAGSRFSDPATIARIVSTFEEKTKRKLTGSNEIQYIKFGQSTDTDREHGVSAGRLILSSCEVASAFEVCANEILSAIQGQLRMGAEKASHVIITGGFGESPYLRARLAAFLEPSGFQIVTSDEPSKKAVAEGLVLWNLSRFVVARAARSTFGTKVNLVFNPSNPEHQYRQTLYDLDGKLGVKGAWTTIVQKGTVLRTSASFSRTYYKLLAHPSKLRNFISHVWSSSSAEQNTHWATDSKGATLPGFTRLADVHADLSPLRSILAPYQKKSASIRATENDIAVGNAYWRVDFEICIFVAETSLKAKLVWYEKGVKREGPASIVFVESADQRGGALDRRRQPADIVAKHA